MNRKFNPRKVKPAFDKFDRPTKKLIKEDDEVDLDPRVYNTIKGIACVFDESGTFPLVKEK